MHPYPVIILSAILISTWSAKSQEIYVSLQAPANRTGKITSHVKRSVNQRFTADELNHSKKGTIIITNKQKTPSQKEMELNNKTKPTSGALSLEQFNAMIIAMEIELSKLNDEDQPITTQTSN